MWPHVAHAGENFGELGGRKGLYLRREDARVARVDSLVRYARGVARLYELDGVEHAAHAQLVDDILAV